MGGTAVAHGLLPVLEALGDELVDARLAADAADLEGRVHRTARAARRPHAPPPACMHLSPRSSKHLSQPKEATLCQLHQQTQGGDTGRNVRAIPC